MSLVVEFRSPGAPLNNGSRGWDKSVLSSPCRLGGFRGQERSFVPLFKGDLGGARLGYNPCLDLVLACLLTQMASWGPPKIQVKCTTACLGIGNWRSAIGHNYYYASL